MTKPKQHFIETHQLIRDSRKDGHSLWDIAKKWMISIKGVHYTLWHTLQPDPTRTEYAIRCLTAFELASSIDTSREKPVFTYTVCRRLRSEWPHGHSYQEKKKQIKLADRRKMFLRAKIHKQWAVDDWNQALWTDASKFEVFGSKWRKLIPAKHHQLKHGDRNERNWEGERAICTVCKGFSINMDITSLWRV